MIRWRGKTEDRFGRPVVVSISEKARGGGEGIAVGFLAIFAAVGVGMGWFLSIRPALQIADARSWQAQTCTVERSSVRSHDSGDGTTYSVDILYRYQAAGTQHRSNRYSFFGGSTSGYQGKAAIVRAHPPGAVVDCWVDPDDPSEAVIERGFTSQAWFGLIPLAFLAAGLGGICFVRRRSARKARRRGMPCAVAPYIAAADPVHDVLPDYDEADAVCGPIVLKAKSSRLGRLAGIVFACLFWNGIVSVFAHQVIESFERGRPEWILTVFLIPFVLVGVALFFAIWHSVFALRNARPTLTANKRVLALGDRLEVSWELRGRIEAVEQLTIVLEGCEKATYQQGTDTRTATHTFKTIGILDTRNHMEMAGGRTSIEIPRDTIHSLTCGHNEIVWELHLEGRIRRWPDIDERYRLVLLPLDPSTAKQEVPQ